MPKIIDHDERRALLAQAALRVVRRAGVEGTTIRSIAAEAGWSRGVIEHYFDNRDDLLAFCYRHALASVFPTVGDLSGDPLDRLVASLLTWLPTDEDGRTDNVIWLDFVGRVRGNEHLRATLAEIDAEWVAATAERFTEVAADPAHRLTVEPVEAARLMSAVVDGLLVADAIAPGPPDRARQERSLRLLLEALVRPRS